MKSLEGVRRPEPGWIQRLKDCAETDADRLRIQSILLNEYIKTSTVLMKELFERVNDLDHKGDGNGKTVQGDILSVFPDDYDWEK
jgi:hypothetical protein